MAQTTVTLIDEPHDGHHGAIDLQNRALELSGFSDLTRRRSRVSESGSSRPDMLPEDVLSLTRSVSAISGHDEEYNRTLGNQTRDVDHEFQETYTGLPRRPPAAKAGTFETISEVPSAFANTPISTRPPSRSGFITQPSSPHSSRRGSAELGIEDHIAQEYPDIGTVKSVRGTLVLLVTCGAQLLDNVFMTGVNISLPAIQREFDVNSEDLQWLISAYTLTFGGFLLLAGVMSDRYGRKNIFCIGMAWLSVWTLADGLATSFIQLAIFRALQGMGAAMTVPSSVGIISSFFVARDRTEALTLFGSAGAVGFAVGLILAGFLTASLGWRYVFYITVILTTLLCVLGYVVLPKDRLEGHVRPRLDVLGAALSTVGLILLSFVLSSGGEYGWSKPFVIAVLLLSVLMLFIFVWVEKKVPNPVMPLSLWKVQNFAATWIAGFVAYSNYQSVVYYMTLTSQQVMNKSAGFTALGLLPMGVAGFACTVSLGYLLERYNSKYLLLVGLALCAIAPIPCALMEPSDLSFWKHVFPTSIIVVVGIATTYYTITVVLLASVPLNAKSLCGGMINTAFQIGSGVGLALASAVVTSTETSKGHGLLAQYRVGMWCCVGFAGIGFLSTLFGVKGVKGGHAVPVGMH